MAGDSNQTHTMPAAEQSHPLRGLLVAQFFGAFNDNAWKIMVALLAMRVAASLGGAGDGDAGAGVSDEALLQKYTAICFVVFTLPLMMVSLPAGVLADRLSKRTVILAMKAMEVLLMAAGTASLYLFPDNWHAPLVVLGCMGVQSAVFSPAKYGILPELLDHEKLSAGNGTLEMWTFIAIVAGTAAGGLLLDATGQQAWLAGALLTVLSWVGLMAAMWVPKVAPARAEGGLGDTVGQGWSIIRGDRVLFLAVAGGTFYWGIASLLGQDVLVYTKSITRGMAYSDALSGLPLALLGIGVGGGSVLAGRLSGKNVEYGLIPLGATGMSLMTLLLGVMAHSLAGAWGLVGTCVLMFFLGISGGMVVVPLNAILQWRSPADRRGAVIALSNVIIFGGILAGSLAGYSLAVQQLDARMILVVASGVVVLGTIWALWLLPDAMIRLSLIVLTHTFYRMRVTGRSHVPEKGGALLVPNHVTFVDGLFILASTDRPVRFVVDASYYEMAWLRPIMKALKAIPISSTGGPRVILRALKEAGKHLDDGALVCIFAEGQISRTGTMMPFRRGMERIVKGRSVPIIPMHLGRAWGSIFSYKGGRFVLKRPQRVPYPVSVSFGEPLPTDTPMGQVRQAVQDLGARAWEHQRQERPCIQRSFIRQARRHPRRFLMGDAIRPKVTSIRAVAGAIALGRVLRSHWANQNRVGILLPPSVAGALVNIAAAIAGRTSVNLNYTAGKAGMGSAVKQARLTMVITSRAFLDKAKLELPQGIHPLFVEDLSKRISAGARLAALLLARWASYRTIERICGGHAVPDPENELTIIFSSGSTGEPKGVILTHANVDANVEAVGQIFPIQAGDKMLGILPLFHSFGFMTLWLAVNHGVGIVFHPNPLDADAIGQAIEKHRLTILIATPTFLQLYQRRCSPGSFGSLRFVLTGAEKLPQRLVDSFQQTFGIRPIEGYGATECSPVVATSTLDVRYDGIYQAGSRPGTVGQPLPNVSVRVVDPDTFEPLKNEQPGMLLVRGPNVMRGYLGRDDLTAKVMRDGWYVTGDIALIDPDGFIKITDRLSRFSKIGGEMVPHGKVEDALQEAAGMDLPTFAVTALPDEKKGERLAVVHCYDEAKIPQLIEKLTEMGLPNLFIPRVNQFVKIDRLPMLGTGKLDLRQVKQIANEALGVGNP